ncbi:hypothetical protein ACRJ4W_10220 [Streptomyces sp. GLT-R25]
MLGETGRFDLDLAEQVTYGDRAILQQFQDPDAYRVSEHPEELGLGLIEGDLHDQSLPAAAFDGLHPGAVALLRATARGLADRSSRIRPRTPMGLI